MADDGHMHRDGARGATGDRAATRDDSEAKTDEGAVRKPEAEGDESMTRENRGEDLECGSRGSGAAGDELAGPEPEPTDGDPEAEPSDASAPSLEEEVAEARRAARENLDRALRAQAELENVRRRMERDLQNAHKFALERFVAELLPVRDSLELGLSASAEKGASAASITEGVELTLRMLEQAMEKFGVRVVDPAGEPFDPAFHQAMTMQENDAVDSGSVLTVVQKGYVLNERLVRPAMVIVAK